MLLFDDLAMAPLWGVVKILRHVYEHAAKELTDEDTVRRQLVELRLQYEMDEVDEQTYTELEADLVARLREIRLAKLAELEDAPDE